MENTDKLIFGLSPRATIINAVLLLVISQLFWTIGFVHQLPADINYSVESSKKLDILVPWYYDSPFEFFSIFMTFTWVNHTFQLMPLEMSWRAVKIKYIYTVLIFIAAEMYFKFIFLVFLLPLK